MVYLMVSEVYLAFFLLLLEKLNAYHYKNHLAHIYIYAYDNKPEIVAKAYRSEAFLIYFSKGVALAKEIGNEQLISIVSDI